jgi:SAM-dependent methyltransferase
MCRSWAGNVALSRSLGPPATRQLPTLGGGHCHNQSLPRRGVYREVVSEAGDLVASGYDAFYATWGRSPTLRQIWRQHVTGADYPEEFAHISFLPMAQLRSLVEGLHLGSDQLLVDLACGAGGPGLWAAKATGARLVGIDLSEMATRRASERARLLRMGERATFRQGTFEATGLASGSADAVMSIDALQYVPDKTAALTEVVRILRPGGRFAFVAFELAPDRIAGLGFWKDAVPDYRPVLEQVGFDIIEYSQIPHWADQVEAGFGAVLADQDALEAELGEAAATAMVMEAAVTIEHKPYRGHVLAVATRN